MGSALVELTDAINKKFDEFTADAVKAAAGNKAAGTRARKCSLEIANKLKAWRKQSIHE